MALFQLPFLKRKEGTKPVAPTVLGRGFIPIDRIRDLAGKGFAEPEMIDVLRREGFSAEEIDRGLTQVLRIGVTGEEVTPMTPVTRPEIPAPPQLPTMEQLQPKQEQQMPEIPETSLPEQYYYPESYSPEEYVDLAVRERIGEINEKIGEFTGKYKELEQRLEMMHQQLSEISKTRLGEDKQLLVKIEGFTDIVNDTNARLGSLEKAFKETLPALIESVRALSDLVQRFKREA